MPVVHGKRALVAMFEIGAVMPAYAAFAIKPVFFGTLTAWMAPFPSSGVHLLRIRAVRLLNHLVRIRRNQKRREHRSRVGGRRELDRKGQTVTDLAPGHHHS
jgi:hypothetical protein